MKKLFLMALAFCFVTAKAQYFQHIYGSATNDEFGVSGINTTGPVPVGQFMVGITLSCLPVNSLPAVYTDMNGNIPGAPFFNENFILSSPTGAMLQVTGLPQPMEFTSCPGNLGIVGSYKDPTLPAPSNTGIFFMQVLPGGNPGPVFNYITPPGLNFDIADVTGLKKSVFFPGDWYLTGTAVDAGGVLRVFAMRFNECTGNIVWSQIYNINAPATNARGRDIEENAMMPFGFRSVAIVGQVTNGPSNDGFLIHVNANTGAPAPTAVVIIGTPGSNEDVRSIRQASLGAFPAGFIIGGTTNVNGNNDFMVIRTNPVQAPFFVSIFDYSVNPGTDNLCYDVIERRNSLCQYEYYATGNASVGSFGGADVMTVKINQFGAGVPLGEFTYGGSGNDFSNKLAQRTLAPCGPPPPNFDGLSIFGSSNSFPGLGGAEMYMIRAYYNGVSGCNEAFNNPLQLGGVPVVPQMPLTIITKLTPNGKLVANYFLLNDITLCFSNMISTGNNAFMAPDKDPTEKAVLIMPNPADVATRQVTLQVESELEGPVDITIYDMLGKQYYNEKHTLVKGVNKLPVDINSSNMAAGMYSVKMRSSTDEKMVILIVK